MSSLLSSNFGTRLASLRKQRGLTLAKLGALVGVSFRVISYYERESKYPPARLLAPLAKSLNVSIDELLGIKSIKEDFDPQHAALWRRLKKIQDLPKADQKALFHYLTALLEKNKKK
ncbi:MAG: helix-turn-helix transcriptional regulator [Candidatus Omnitrophota bacterium]